MSSYTTIAPRPLKLLTVWPVDLADEWDNALFQFKSSMSVMLDNTANATSIGSKVQPGRVHILLMPTEVWLGLPPKSQELLKSRIPLLLLTPLVQDVELNEQGYDTSANILVLSKVYERETLLTFLASLVAQLVAANEIKDAVQVAWRQAVGTQQDFILHLVGESEAIWPVTKVTERNDVQRPSPSSSLPSSSGPTMHFNNSTVGNVIQNANTVNINQNLSPMTAVNTDWMFEKQESNTETHQLSIKLHQILLTHFDEEELRTLCFYLPVDYDILPGRGKAGKARDLILYLNRIGHISDLVTFVQQRRPDIIIP